MKSEWARDVTVDQVNIRHDARWHRVLPSKLHRIPVLLFAFLLGLPAMVVRSAGSEFDLSHSALTSLLGRVVSEARVDYAMLKAEPAPLDRYLMAISSVSRTTFGGWDKADRIAFLCNAYNAFTLRLIRDHYPVKSIREIGGAFRSPWDLPIVLLFEQSTTLDKLEHQWLRKEYQEPRIHFALVCAAVGCPPLREEAYVGSALGRQLDDQARRFLASSDKNRVGRKERVVYLSPIFKWYGEDFEQSSGSVLAALRSYWPGGPANSPGESFRIRYTDYDWALNDRAR